MSLMKNNKGIDSISDLNQSWKTVRFGDVVKDVKESEKNPLDAGFDRYIGLEHIEPENLHIKQWGDLRQDEVSFTKRFRKGQVLFGKRRAYQRKVAVAEFDGICSSDILTFEPKGDDLLPELLPFIVQSDAFFEHALDTSSGSLSPRTRWSQLKEFEFPLPPKDEQRRIAEILLAIDDYGERSKDVVQDLKFVCEQSIIEVLENGFTQKGTESWERTKLGSQCVLKNGHGFKASEWSQHGLPIIRIQNLNGSSDFNHFEGVPDDSWIIETGDLLYSWAGVKGKSFGPCLWHGPRGLLNQHIYRIIPNDDAHKHWLFETLKMITHRIEKKAHGFKLELVHARKSDITDQSILVPSYEEQVEIATFAKQCRSAVSLWEQRLQDNSDLKKLLIADLLSGEQNAVQ